MKSKILLAFALVLAGCGQTATIANPRIDPPTLPAALDHPPGNISVIKEPDSQ